jgi:glycosyltransferase involved in cell wall biosynthesis
MSSPHIGIAQISVIIPCFNEEAVLPALFERLTTAAESWSCPWEMIAVDDGSHDVTWELLVAQNQRDPRWKAISFSRNFGQQIAVSAGLFHAKGDAVIVIDADLQDPPEELHRFIAKWREGFEVVYAVRTKRKESLPKRFCYWLFYRSLAKVSKSPVPLDAGDFCLMDRKVVEVIKAMPERNRFIRGLRAWAGFKQIGLSYERHSRAGGEIKHTLSSLMGLALDGLFSFSTVPLRLASYLGFFVSGVALLGVIFTFAQRIFHEWFASIGLGPVPGFATIVISILFLGGVQLICIGILGEYLGRIFDEVKRRPTWLISKGVGVTPQAPPL